MRARSVRALSAGTAMVLVLGVAIAFVGTSADAAARRAPKHKPVAVFIGDSFTQGAGASRTVRRFTTRVAMKEGWSSVNLGLGGTGYVTTSSEGALSCGTPYCGPYGERVDDAMVAKPAVVIVSGGINDVGRPLPEFRSGVDQLFENLKAHLPKRTFVAVTTPQWPAADPPEEFLQMVAAVKASARDHKVHYLDIGQPLASGVDVKAVDGVHPNDAGHRLLAELVERRLERLHHP